MKLSIIILNYRREKLIDQCLRAILQYSPAGKYEIVVVNNDTDRKAYLDLKNKWEKKGIAFISTGENLGYAAGNQLGIQNTMGEYFIIINPDVFVREQCLTRMLQFMDTHPRAGIVGPQLIYPDGVIQDSYRAFPRLFDQVVKRIPLLRRIFTQRMYRYLRWDKDPDTIEAVDWIVGACYMFRRKYFEKIGGFQGGYFLFMDEADLAWRMWSHRYEVYYLPTAQAEHHHTRLSAGGFFSFFNKKAVRIHTWDALKYFLRHVGRRSPRA